MGTGPGPGSGDLDAVPIAASPPATGRPGQGPGWAKLAQAVALRVPPAEIETIYLFRPFKREGREWGTAVVTRRHPEGRLLVYTGRYMLVVRGKERGQTRLEIEEVALSPAEVVNHVMQRTAERTGESDPPAAFGPAVWYEDAPVIPTRDPEVTA